MKKSLWMLGVAVAALTSCTSNEVMEIAENRAIGFNTFVNNNTRAVTEVTSLTDFYVIGKYGASAGSYTEGTVFNNELSSATYYWTANKYYKFAGYADGTTNGKLAPTFDPAQGTLKFENYTPNDTKDLVVAISEEINCTNPANQQAVPLNFKHMLAQLKFTFNTKAGDAYTIKVSGLKVNAVKTGATGTYTKSPESVAWTAGQTADYTFAVINDVAVAANNNTATTGYSLVIPQGNTQQLKVTFTAEVSGPEITPTSKQFTATLDYNANSPASLGTANTWTAGYRYNYVAEINPENILQLYPITFKPQVEAWTDANTQSTTPATPTL